jgi:DNA-binding transcriptional LysR family regulator
VDVIPLGTFNQVPVPSVPIEDRPTDIFFAGSVEHRASLRHRLGSPKTLARREMVAAVDRLARRRPGLRVDLRTTAGFAASEAASAAEYSLALMNSRICLAPRGTSVETFRVFEGLRFGCVVVAERLPRHWFYAGGPVVQLDRWNDLEEAVRPMLDDPAELRRCHEAALGWWNDRCSEPAVGRFIADRLNALVDDDGT